MGGERRHFRIDFGYDGTAFHGSQRQRDLRTVQAVIEEVLQRLTGQQVNLAFAGRTDRGVHAIGQVASGEMRWRKDGESLRFALDSLVADDVTITGVREVSAAFHARFSAREREYRYRIWNAPVPAVLLRRFTWHVREPLDVDRMNAVAALLIGERDFSSLAGAGVGVAGAPVDCVRTVTLAEWSEISVNLDRTDPAIGRMLEFRVRADRFLPHMVRNMVGSTIDVGTETRSVAWFDEMLAQRDRRVASAPSPPQGLVLWSVGYPEGSEV